MQVENSHPELTNESLIPSVQVSETKLTTEYVAAHADLPASHPSGGDFHAAFRMDDGTDNIAMVMGDVAGHGPEQTAQASHMKELLSDCLSVGLSPAESLTAVNAILEPDPNFEVFGTVFVGTLEAKTGKLTYASGGHEPALISQPEDETHDSIEELEGSGPPLGAFSPEIAKYEESETTLPAGGTLLLYTDGVPDARTPHARADWLGLQRLKQIFGQVSELSPRQLIGQLLHHVSEFCRGQFRDDVAVMAIRRRLPKSSKKQSEQEKKL